MRGQLHANRYTHRRTGIEKDRQTYRQSDMMISLNIYNPPLPSNHDHQTSFAGGIEKKTILFVQIAFNTLTH